MGGFYTSHGIKTLMKEDKYPFELDHQIVEDIFEQCLVLTEMTEEVDVVKLIEYGLAFYPETKKMPSSLSTLSQIALAKMEREVNDRKPEE